MIVFTNYKKEYSGNTVLDIPNLQMPNGTYWLKGINGSGKSTLLKSLSGLIPFTGNIFIDNVDIKKQKRQHRKMVNYGEAAPIFPTFLTGNDLINFYVQLKSGNVNDCLQFCNELQLGVDALNKQIGAYSSGMLKKLSLVLAFTGNASWILLDEPLITLDVAAIKIVLQKIEACSNKGTKLILTSHQDMDFPTNAIKLTTILVEDNTIKGLS